MRILPVLATVLLLASCDKIPLSTTAATDDALTLKASSFEKMVNWQGDDPRDAADAMKKSCARLMKKDPAADMGVGGFAGKAADWQEPCQKLLALDENADTRAFFEENFTPYEVWGSKGREGLFTGYYEPTLHGSLKKHGKYKYPIYSRPNDLISVSLGDFKQSLKGETIMGRVEGQKFVPYYKREAIEEGVLKKRSAEIVWVDSDVDAFFLHIQGSGRVELENGDVVRVGYAAENGQQYTAIGKELLQRGELEKGNVSMQSIREWLDKNPDKADEIMNVNTSYIFFHELKHEGGPLGAEGVPLTPGRSIAVDRKKIPYGVPLWLEAEGPDKTDCIMQLMIAQDTGGAITGAVRGDFFWGPGNEAAHKAGIMKSKGIAWLLLPKSVVVPQDKLRHGW